jgi:hypothetical protein
MAGVGLTAMGIESFFVYNLVIFAWLKLDARTQ